MFQGEKMVLCRGEASVGFFSEKQKLSQFFSEISK